PPGRSADKQPALAVTAHARLVFAAAGGDGGPPVPTFRAARADPQIARRVARRRHVKRKRDARSVGAPRRLVVIRGARRELNRLAAGCRDLPDVAAHRARDPSAVGAPRGLEPSPRHRPEPGPLLAPAGAEGTRALPPP